MKVEFSENRVLNHSELINLVKHDDKKKATALSIWERFLDLFRSSEKKSVIDSIYNNINENPEAKLGGEVYNRFYNFEKLKSLALPDYRYLFEIKMVNQGDKGSKYTFLIDKFELFSFETPNNWESLSKIEFYKLPLIENFGFIAKTYVDEHCDKFKKSYPDIKIKNDYGADEMMNYSCFFLEENPDIKLLLLEYGLFDIDVMKSYVSEMSERLKDNDDRIGNFDYRLTTLYIALNSLKNHHRQD